MCWNHLLDSAYFLSDNYPYNYNFLRENNMAKNLNLTTLLKSFMILSTSLLISNLAQAYLPLLDNQPHATEVCPISTNTNHTVVNGEITARNYNCVIEGTNVVYSIAIPEGCETGGCGLIVDIHGGSMNANTQNNGTQLREYGNIAVSRGALTPYIVLQPNFTDVFDDLNFLFIDIDSLINSSGAYLNELPNLINVIDQVVDTFDIDENRMHMHGFSRGSATTTVFYCNEQLGERFASFGMGGGDIAAGDIFCDVQPNRPLIFINGIYDRHEFLSYSLDGIESYMLGLADLNQEIVQTESGWEHRTISFSLWSGITLTGRHHHQRFISGDYLLETVRHSAKGPIPYFGHCHPRMGIDRWLVCRANFDIGQKLVDFFIANPK